MPRKVELLQSKRLVSGRERHLQDMQQEYPVGKPERLGLVRQGHAGADVLREVQCVAELGQGVVKLRS
ncbi:hypothetical protein GCM10010385_47930 [Streptomyces geysiriensis]|nr:hypothetical protein GCM10010385_47930 [Streptomyces geysiriensis]